MFSKILVGYDGCKGGKKALETACSIAKQYNSKIVALWVCEPPPPHYALGESSLIETPPKVEIEKDLIDAYFKARCKEINEIANKQGVKVECNSITGNPAHSILDFAEEGKFDLIVVGHSDHFELWGRLLGDTADRICDHSKCSVLVVK